VSDLSIILFALLVVALAFITAVLIIFPRARRPRTGQTYADTLAAHYADAERLEKLSGNDALYCRDCGSLYVSLRTQEGFDRRTGEPDFRYERGCPKASPLPTASLLMRWPDCGRRVAQSFVPRAHNHPDPTATTTTCPVCVDQMLGDGVINQVVATKLYDEAKAKVGQQRNAGWAALMSPSVSVKHGNLPPPK